MAPNATENDSFPSTQKICANILLVEDEALVVEDLTECLEGFGHRIIGIADRAEQAIALARTLQPDLVIMDISLKGAMNGIEAAAAIRKHQDVPIVFLTAFSDEQLLHKAQAAMPYGYLLKPYKERELKATVQMALYKHRFDLQVRENQQWLHAVLCGMADGVIVCDGQAKVAYMNTAAERLTGFDKAEALGRRASEVLRLSDARTGILPEHPLEIALHEKRNVSISTGTLLNCKDGSQLPICDSCAPVFNKHQELVGAVCIFHDDSARLNEERRVLSEERTRQLEVQVAELEKLDRLKEDFLSTVSHELRTPLANIKLALQLLRNECDVEARERYIAILQAQTEREINLVNALLDLQMLERRLDLPQEYIHLQKWLARVAEPFRNQASQNQQEFALALHEEALYVSTYPALLERAVTELLHNACKYTPADGSIQVQTRVLPAAAEAGACLQICFINTCQPISEAELVRLFDKFYRVPNNDPWQYGGTGIGLTLVKRLIEQLQGTILVENSGEGRITFLITLPLVPVPLA